MNLDRWKHLKEIFQEAILRPPAERAAYLDEACGSDASLRAEVESLLASHASTDSFLETPAAGGDFTPEEETSWVDTRIGQYQLVRVISSGGMGTVYEAIQEQPRRTVAIKVMKEGLASRSALRRFEYESQILARLTHPNIARVIEAGTHVPEGGPDRMDKGGVPYFVMEYVLDARTITEYAAEKRLAPKDRVALFLQVCHAVHHGHQKGIIHRDLKPGNILVDGNSQVKIIDFGVARATDADLRLTTVQTGVGQLIGTLQYMSPEQCRADPNDLDIRSDVYALGVVLYELLCGRLPYDLKKAAMVEAARRIQEEPPRRPSTTDRTLRGDLETILLKSLEKEQKDRYQTISAFSEDLGRFLRGEVILARPAGPATRFYKQVKRNPLLSATTGVALLMLVAFYLYAVCWSLPRITEERNKAVKATEEAEEQRGEALAAKDRIEKESTTVEAMNQLLKEMLSTPNPGEEGSDLKVVDALEKAADKVGGMYADQPEIEGTIRLSLGDIYRSLGQYEDAESQLAEALEVSTKLHGENSHISLDLASRMAAVMTSAGRFGEAEALFRVVLAKQKELLGERNEYTLFTMNNLALALENRGEYDEAEALHLKVLDIKEKRLGREDPSTLVTMSNLATLRKSQGRMQEAEALNWEVLNTRTAMLGETHEDTLKSMNNLATALQMQGKLEEAEAMHRKVLSIRKTTLSEDHPYTIGSLANLGFVLNQRRRYKEAETLLTQALAANRRVLNDDHPNTFKSMNLLANTKVKLGKYEEAKPLFLEAIDGRRRVLSPTHRHTLSSQGGLANMLLAQRKYGEAETLYREILKIREKVLEADHIDIINTRYNLAIALKNQGKFEEAEALYLDVLERRRLKLGDRHSHTRAVIYSLALLYEAQDRDGKAEEMHRELLDICESLYGKGDKRTFKNRHDVARTLLHQGKVEEAEAAHLALLEERKQVLGLEHEETLTSLCDLGRLYEKDGRLEESAALYAEAVAHEHILPRNHPLIVLLPLNYGDCLFKLQRFEESEEQLLNAHRRGAALYEPGHHWSVSTLEKLIHLYKVQNRQEDHAAWMEKLEAAKRAASRGK